MIDVDPAVLDHVLHVVSEFKLHTSRVFCLLLNLAEYCTTCVQYSKPFTCTFADRGHFNENDFPELVGDIKSVK